MADPVSAAIAAVIKFGTEAILATGLVASQTTAAAIATFGVQAAGTAVLSTAINAVLQPNVGAGGSPTQWQSDTDSGVPFVMGRRAVAGHAVHIDEWGPDNRYLSVVNVYSGAGPIKAFGEFYADETVVSFGGAYNKVSTGSYKDVMWMDRRMGAQPDTALASPSDPAVAGSLPGWTSAYKLSGKASSMWTLALDKERKRYPAGAPKPLQVIEGIYGYDPRLDSTYPGGSGSCRLNDRSTYVWIENPIIGALNFAIGLRENGKVVTGIAEDDTPSLSGIDADAFIACANVADANGWTLSAAWTTKDDKHQVYIAMLQAGGAKDCTVAGKLSCYTRGAPKTSVVTISAADTAGPIEISTAAPRIGRVNTIIPRCVLETHKWEMTPCDEVSVPAHVTTDRAKRSRGMDYPFVADAVQASQLAGIDIEDSREPITGRMPLKRYMQQLKPGDAFTITEQGFYLDGLKAIVVDREVDTGNGIVTITFRSDTDAKYDFALGLDPTPPEYPGLTPPDPNDVAVPSSDGWTATGSSVTTGTGQNTVGHPALTVTGDFVNEDVASAVIEYRKASDSAWIYHGEFAAVADFSTLIQPLSPDTLYDVSVRLRNIFGVLGDEADRLILEDVQTPPLFTANRAVEANSATPGSDLDIDLTNAEIRVDRLEGPSGNLVFDPLFILGPNEWSVSDASAPFLDQEASPRALLVEFEAASAGVARVLRLSGRQPATEGERFEVAAEALFEGVTSAATIGVVFYNAAGAAISTETAALTGALGRSGGFVAAPEGTASALLELSISADGAGEGAFRVKRPLWRKADAAQGSLTTFVDSASANVTRIKETRIAAARAAARELVLQAANADALAQIRNIVISQVEGGSALASDLSALTARVGGNEADIQTLSEAIATGSDAQAAILEALRISVGQLNGFEDPLFLLGASDWSGSPNPPWLDQEEADRALRLEGTAAATGEVARMTHSPRFRVAGSERVEVAADIKLSGVANSASVRAVFYDAADTLISDAVVASGGSTAWSRVGGFVSVPASARSVAFAVSASAVTTGDYALLARKPYFGGASDGQSVLTPFLATLSPRVAEAQRRLVANARSAAEGIRLAVSDANRSAAAEAERTARLTGDAAEAQQRETLEARVTTNEGDIATRATIASLNQAVADAESARATLETNLTAAFQAADTGLQSDIDTRATITALNTAVSDAAAARAALESSITAAYQAADNGLQTDINSRATITALNQAISDAESANASLATSLRAEWQGDDAGLQTQIDSRATIAALQQVEADAASARATLQSTLEASINGNTAAISVNAGAIADLETATAFWELLVAAGGGDPAIFRLRAGEGGSEITLASTVLGFWNTDGAGSLVKAMEIQSGIVRIINELRLGTGAAVTSFFDEGGPGEQLGMELKRESLKFWTPDGREAISITSAGARIDGGVVEPVKAAKLLTADASAAYGNGVAGPVTTIASVKLSGVTIPNILTLHGSRLRSRIGANAAANTSVVATWRLSAGTSPTTQVQTLAQGLVSYTQSGSTIIEQANDFYERAVQNKVFTLDESLTGDVWINLTIQVTSGVNAGDQAFFEGDNADPLARTQLSVAVVNGATGAVAV